MKTIWEKIEKILEKNLVPVVLLREEWEVEQPKRLSGRPRTWEVNKFENYAAYKGKKGHPRCMRVGCINFLKKDQRFVCSEFCRKEIIKECKTKIALLEGRFKIKR